MRCFAVTVVTFYLEILCCVFCIAGFVAFVGGVAIFGPKSFFQLKATSACYDLLTKSNIAIYDPPIAVPGITNTKKCIEIADIKHFVRVETCGDDKKYCAKVFDSELRCNNNSNAKLSFGNNNAEEDDTCQLLNVGDSFNYAAVFKNMNDVTEVVLYVLGFIKK